ncbi:peptide-methionine (R)-S-oxide reductase [Pilimelia anulata]|uniref:peptide-methionine (R)-S-oxide reductase n=1 Tax=Pilimelia anulata TaxID=53371 RepID=A0A8J3F8G6_9ACTN|nr:peptide-methionine (R)-S-oxide reductase MsrB [Pilimelia anulata]GGJ78059.1 peptide-methionine (R)-S-oxide reductase [Pilimelia anulata]
MSTPAEFGIDGGGALPADEEQWRVRLDPEEFRVLRGGGTERPFTGEFVEHKVIGAYHCRGCGQELFTSGTKFDSGCGWPSFAAAEPDRVRLLEDRSHGMVRTEVRCARCDSHLGHVFYGEGFTPENARYCINSICLTFSPAE